MTEFNKRRDKPYEKRNSADARFQRNESGDSYNSNRSNSYNSERKPRFSGDNNRNSDRPYSPRKSYGDSSERSFERKPYEKKQWGDKPYSERKSYDKKPYEHKQWNDKAYSERKPYERKPFEKKSWDDKPFERKPYDKKPYEGNNDRPERKSFDKKPFERKPFERKRFEDKPFERKPYERKSWDDKPYEKKSFERKPFNRFEKTDDFAGKRPAWYEGKTGISRRGEENSERDNSRNYRPRREFTERKSTTPKLRMLDVFENKEQEFELPQNTETRNLETTSDEVRLNKFIANAGVCSRREADELILSGKITVNGEVKNELGTRINPKTDNVLFDGAELQSQRKVYILLNKPKDTISTKSDPEGRKTVYDIIAGACNENVEAVGRLDRNTTGVFLFTNDGDMAQKILHPKFNKMKIYHVHLDKNLKADDFEKITAGVELEDGFVEVDDLQFVGSEKNQIGIQIHTGKNHVVKRIFEHYGYTVEKLDRVYFAGLTKKNLPRGKWRFLSRKEIDILKQGAYE